MSILVTEDKIVTFVNDEHSEKELCPIKATEEGIVICDNEKHNLEKLNPSLFLGLLIKESIPFGKKKKFNESIIVLQNLSQNWL